ncbi:MAG: Zn-ribbon domain-containing protein [Methanoregulaceae archaeon]|nr:Zn-ribbon domain-containing protein [Methanoregulaceae archaeon]
MKGCSCGGKKFYFERPDVQRKRSAPVPPAPEPKPEPVQEKTEADETDRFDRVESIRIIAPGTYELNIEKMAQSDERVVGLGQEGSYALDLLSMAGSKKGKKIRR